MKILFLGEVSDGQTSLMRMQALQQLGHDVVGVNTVAPWLQVSWLSRQLQRRIERGSVIRRINHMVLARAREFRPQLIWAEKQEYLWPSTIRSLRTLNARLLHFTPDPYFSLAWKRTRLMDGALSEFDVLVYCKAYERLQYETIGLPTIYMPLGFSPTVHRPVASTEARWHSAVGFLGGWEPRRESALRAVTDAGVQLKIWGGAWDFLSDGRWSPRRHIVLSQLAGNEAFRIHKDAQIASAVQGGEVYGDDYARALSGAKIGLGFLREVCEDQHTTRSFEIPACGSMLLADRTGEHQQFFEEGREAEYFGCEDELVEKVKYYSSNERARFAVAVAGRRRCLRSGYSYEERLRATLRLIERV